MKNISILIWVFVFFLSACQSKESKQAALNESNLKRYLSNTFDINTDTLNSRLVLIDFMGCKPCIHNHLRFLSEHVSGQTKAFHFVIPRGALPEFKDNFPVHNDFPILIDSNNVLYRQNIIIEGLSIYNFKQGRVKDLSTISIFTRTEDELHKFWFEN